jgi:hypothetical protein
MNHSGWKKLNRANSLFQAHPITIPLVSLFTFGFIFALPEIDSTYDIKERDFIFKIIGNVSIPSGQFENETFFS